MSHDAKTYHHLWYLKHRDEQRAGFKARYQRHRQEVVAKQRAYRGTAAGMLAQVRRVAKKRSQ